MGIFVTNLVYFWIPKNEIYECIRQNITMYWLRSMFEIRDIRDLELLIRIYDGVSGELYVGKDHVLDIKWCVNPFLALKNKLGKLQFPFIIFSRLIGPQTLIAVSPKLRKTRPSSDPVIKQWADQIDSAILAEMNRQNDIGLPYENPCRLLTEKELLEAAMSSKYAERVFFGDTHLILTNMKMSYVKSFPFETEKKNDGSTHFIQFDKDDGLDNFEGFSYMKEKFEEWKSWKYEDDLADYCHEYASYLQAFENKTTELPDAVPSSIPKLTPLDTPELQGFENEAPLKLSESVSLNVLQEFLQKYGCLNTTSIMDELNDYLKNKERKEIQTDVCDIAIDLEDDEFSGLVWKVVPKDEFSKF